MNPNLYMGWMGTGMNPASYGNTWQGFTAYPYPAQAAMPMQAPSAWPVMLPGGVAPPPAAPVAPMPR